MGEGLHLCAAPPPGRAVQRFGLHLTWLFRVLGGHHLPLAAQDLSTPMAQTLPDAVAGPATFTHVRVGVRMYVRMKGPLDLISLYGRLTGLVVAHAPQRGPLTRSPPGPKVQRRSGTFAMGDSESGRASDLGHLRYRSSVGDGDRVKTVIAAPAPIIRRARSDMVRRLVAGGGRFSTDLGIDVEAGEAEIDRWFLAATLYGTRIPTAIAERTFHVLDEAGVTVATARTFSWDDLVALLDRGGYGRYDFKTATRLHLLCDVLSERYGGRVCAIPDQVRTAAELEAALDDLPGWGPVTVGVFLRELRGVWPLAAPALDARAEACVRHLGLLGARTGDPLDRVRSLSAAAGIDPRDLEGALVRTALAHRGGLGGCPGGRGCSVLAHPAMRPPARAPVPEPGPEAGP